MKKPEFMRNIALSYPEFDKTDDLIFGYTHKAIVDVVESFDDAIVSKIIEIAKEEGINSLVLLNKREIVSAFEKQIPKKPMLYNKFERHCECGAIVKSYYKYCYECGQALDWGDTK